MTLDQLPDDSQLRQQWNQLVGRMEQPQVFYTFEWAVSIQRAFESIKPLYFLGYEENDLIGVAALAVRSSGEVAFLAADTADYCDFLCGPGRRLEFVSAVFSELSNHRNSRLVLTNLPTDSASVHAISEAAPKFGYHLHMRPAYACARVLLGAGDDREQLKQSVLGKKRLRRNMRELQKREAVSVVHDADSNRIQELLETFSHVHVTRFLETGKLSSLLSPERRTFLSELTREAGRNGWVVMSRLLSGKVAASWHYGFQFAGSWFWYQPTVDPLYGHFSPGYCLLAKIVEAACDSPEFDMVDLGLGAEGYKERFATATRQTLYCELNASIAQHARTALRYRASALATQSPRIEQGIRSAISRTAALRSRLKTRDTKELIAHSTRRLKNAVSSAQNVLFFQWPSEVKDPEVENLALRALDADLLGASAIRYASDADTIQYLMRSAQRIGSPTSEGFVLTGNDGVPVHFCWVKDFEGFDMAELRRKLNAPAKDAIMIFDCYTPALARGNQYFSKAITLLANRQRSLGKDAWIFGAETNHASLRGIQKTAFEYRFTLGQRTNFFRKTRVDSMPAPIALGSREDEALPVEKGI